MMSAGELGFIHRYQPAAEPGAPTLLLLHGTGGNEDDMLPLARMLAPGAGALSPRGKVLERGMPRFFRRLAEGVFDLNDLRRRTAELATFVRAAAARYGFDGKKVIGVGFSNGANIAASLLLLEPDVLAGAILFRAMVPLIPEKLPSLADVRVLLSNGRQDPMVPPGQTEQLETMLREAGAAVTLAWQPTGHELTHAEVKSAREWLAE